MVVMVDGLEEYVCKYSANTPANKLLIEYLGYSFACLWDIPVPDAAFVRVLPEHVPKNLPNYLQPRSFDIPTFGSRYHPGSKEIDQSVISSWLSKPSQLKRIKNKTDLLKTGLFDIWLSNEDRVHNNTNLLVAAIPDGMKIMAIDHEKCFNSGVLDVAYPMYQINSDDSILSFDLVPLLFKQGAEFERIKSDLLNEFPSLVSQCQNRLAQILQLIPPEWRIDTDETERYLNSNIFALDWLKETNENFTQFVAESFSKL